MKMLKLTRFSLIVTMLLLGTLLFNACTDTACTTKVCQNGGVCFENELGVAECECPEGYSGLDCEEDRGCSTIVCPDNVTTDSPEYDSTDGSCACYCNDGYEGDECDLEIRDRITGGGVGGKKYTATDVCNEDSFVNTVEIIPSNSGIRNFTILNFGAFDDLPANVTCEIVGINEDGNLQFVIPKHVDSNGEGTRTIDSYQSGDSFAEIGTFDTETNVLSISWKVEFGDGTSDACTTVFEPF